MGRSFYFPADPAEGSHQPVCSSFPEKTKAENVKKKKKKKLAVEDCGETFGQ
jgi:hypothetical protein